MVDAVSGRTLDSHPTFNFTIRVGVGGRGREGPKIQHHYRPVIILASCQSCILHTSSFGHCSTA